MHIFQPFKGVRGYSTLGYTCLHVSQGWAKITTLGSSQSNVSLGSERGFDTLASSYCLIRENGSLLKSKRLTLFEEVKKGYIRGRIKVCLGRLSDKNVMVIKFLGTFTSLGDAEKLHKYFDEN
ncbi:hypothetical protein CFP56_006454 [Quercus suber]|uniref:Uncharacterized protein n=1 Tax=Quercus suber TaxID=58331 RepID=A0AAW0LBA3_QUESU